MGNCLPINNQVVPIPILNSAETAAEANARQTVKIKTYLDTAKDLNPESLFSIYLLPIKIASLLYNHDNSYGEVIEKYCSFGCDTFYSMKTTDIVYLCFKKGSKNPADYCGHAVCHHLTVKNTKYLCIKNDNIYLYLTDYTEVDLSNILFEIQILDTVNNIKNENKIPGIGTSILTFLKKEFKQQSIYLRSVSAAYTFYVKNGFFSAIYSNDNPIKEFPILWKPDEPSPSEDLTKYKFYYKGIKYDDNEQKKAYLYTKEYPYILNWSENSLIPCIYKLIKRGGRNRRILKLNNMY